MTRRDIVLALVVTAITLIYIMVAGGNFALDDSWIHQTYARNVGLFGEWSFVRGEPSAASTSPLYTVILAIGYVLRIPFRIWTHGIGITALSLTAILGARIAEKYTGSNRAGWAAGLALALTWHLIWAAASGMETIIISMWTLVLIALTWREGDNLADDNQALLRRGAIFGTCVALATLTRPEGVLLGGLAALLMLIVRPQGTLRNVIIWGIGSALAFVVVLAPYLLLNYQLTGGILPNTAAAKFQQHAHLLNEPLYLLYSALVIQIIAGGQALLLVGCVIYIFNVFRKKTPLNALYDMLPLLWSVGLILLYALRLPAAYQHGRYVIPALPPLILIGVIGLHQLMTIRTRQLIVRVIKPVIPIATAMLFVIFAVWGIEIYRVDVAIIDGEMVKSAHWIADNLPEDELLAIHDIGAVGYFAPRSMLDIAGLVSPDVVDIVGNGDALWQLMEDRNAQYLMAFPDQIPGRNPNDPRLCEIYSTDAQVTQNIGQPNMKIYLLDYDATCEG